MLRLDWCSYEAAKYAVMHWHYSKVMPKSKLVQLGVWEDGQFVGVIMFGGGATPNLCKPYGLRMYEGCELLRIALQKHSIPVTQMVAVAIKMLKKQSPGLRLIVSFADPRQGHHGGIYQGGNWVFCGVTAQSKMFRSVDGVLHHERTVSSTGFKKQGRKMTKCMKPSEAIEVIDCPGKYRYLYPLDKAMRRQIEPLRQPYPKRVGSIDSDAPAFQPDEGGANPTSTLHSMAVSA